MENLKFDTSRNGKIATLSGSFVGKKVKTLNGENLGKKDEGSVVLTRLAAGMDSRALSHHCRYAETFICCLSALNQCVSP